MIYRQLTHCLLSGDVVSLVILEVVNSVLGLSVKKRLMEELGIAVAKVKPVDSRSLPIESLFFLSELRVQLS